MQVDMIRVERSIRFVRGDKVILDEDLALLYGIETKKLVQAVKRNMDRFPADFMFQLTNQEFVDLRSQIVTSSQWGGRRTPPYAFSEQGVAMLSSVLHSPRAVQVNIEIMRTFVRLRRILASHADLAERLEQLERGQSPGSTIGISRWRDPHWFDILSLTGVWLMGSVTCSFRLTSA